jgi:tetratricopeptide (TPR) repeat protein
MEDRLATDDYCNGCHMPKSGSIDIPHVTVHDHYIRKPKKEAEKIAQVRQFLGLTAVNNAQPSERSKIRAFLQQYEKFGGEPFLLDSAAQLLRRQSTTLFFNEKVQLWHLKGDFSQVLKTVGERGEAIVLRDHLTKKSYDNEHAWTAYRIGEAYLQKGQQEIAEKFVSQAIVLAPYILSFQNKLGAIHVRASRWEAAKMQYEKILLENDYHTEAHANLGYVNLRLGHWSLAEQNLTKALQQRPDYELALLNLGLLYLQQDKLEASRRVTKRLLRINPTHSEGIHLLSIINQNL